jgi:hypothetical protein
MPNPPVRADQSLPDVYGEPVNAGIQGKGFKRRHVVEVSAESADTRAWLAAFGFSDSVQIAVERQWRPDELPALEAAALAILAAHDGPADPEGVAWDWRPGPAGAELWWAEPPPEFAALGFDLALAQAHDDKPQRFGELWPEGGPLDWALRVAAFRRRRLAAETEAASSPELVAGALSSAVAAAFALGSHLGELWAFRQNSLKGGGPKTPYREPMLREAKRLRAATPTITNADVVRELQRWNAKQPPELRASITRETLHHIVRTWIGAGDLPPKASKPGKGSLKPDN